jgi:hypothetical protein
MLKTVRKRYPDAQFKPRGGNEVAVVMPFAPPANGSNRPKDHSGGKTTTED